MEEKHKPTGSSEATGGGTEVAIPGETVEALVAEMALRCPFGPGFFVQQLGSFVRDRCPDPAEALPIVTLQLADGEVLEVCHVIGLAPRWVALATREKGKRDGPMLTDLVPYGAIQRVTIRQVRAQSGQIGFDQHQPPSFLAHDGGLATPAEVLRAAAGPGGQAKAEATR